MEIGDGVGGKQGAGFDYLGKGEVERTRDGVGLRRGGGYLF